MVSDSCDVQQWSSAQISVLFIACTENCEYDESVPCGVLVARDALMTKKLFKNIECKTHLRLSSSSC